MFGPQAGLLARNAVPPELPNEDGLVQDMRTKLGPHAAQPALLHHLRLCRGKLGWSVNSYLRAALSREPPARGREDFQQPPPAAAHAARGAACAGGAPGGGAAPVAAASSNATGARPLQRAQQPAAAAQHAHQPQPEHSLVDACSPALLERILGLLDVQSLCSAASSCGALAKAARSDTIWQALFEQRWGSAVFPTDGDAGCSAPAGLPSGASSQAQQAGAAAAAAASAGNVLGAMAMPPPPRQAPAGGGQPGGSPRRQPEPPAPSGGGAGSAAPALRDGWRERYRCQAGFAASMSCPRCAARRSMLPVVFGFPSRELMQAMDRRRVVLGGDHLLDNCQVWTCTACAACWRWWPYEQPARWLADTDVRPGRHIGAGAAQDAAAASGRPAYTYEL